MIVADRDYVVGKCKDQSRAPSWPELIRDQTSFTSWRKSKIWWRMVSLRPISAFYSLKCLIPLSAVEINIRMTTTIRIWKPSLIILEAFNNYITGLYVLSSLLDGSLRSLLPTYCSCAFTFVTINQARIWWILTLSEDTRQALWVFDIWTFDIIRSDVVIVACESHTKQPKHLRNYPTFRLWNVKIRSFPITADGTSRTFPAFRREVDNLPAI